MDLANITDTQAPYKDGDFGAKGYARVAAGSAEISRHLFAYQDNLPRIDSLTACVYGAAKP